ncbi:MAG TPA: cupredoxin domain-containing protein [Sphingomicrobium sp.]|nr:cupredoxin domain-containing protein [Sphingomicrobium sp.]
MRNALLLAFPLALLGAQAATPQAPTAVNVQLSNYKFTPRTIVLDHGRPYVLRLHNASGGGHDFTAPAFFAASRVAPEDRRLVAEGEVEVRPGTTHEIHLTAPAAPGRYKVKCTHTFHKFFGMSGTIVVR